jgi:hypothetical protein
MGRVTGAQFLIDDGSGALRSQMATKDPSGIAPALTDGG